MTTPLFTPAARRHGAAMARAIAPSAARLDRDFRIRLRKRDYDEAQVRACLAITPAARARLRTIRAFLEQVEYNGARLARLNVTPAEVNEVLAGFRTLLDPLLAGKHQPAREQLQLATILTVEKAFYRVREA